MTRPGPLAEAAVAAYLAGLTAVDGTRLVKAKVRTGALDDWFEDRNHPKQIHVLALGKAAPAMLWGLVEASVPFKGIGVAPRQRTRPTVDTFRWLDGDHPVPGPASFAAGAAIRDWAAGLPKDTPLLVLLSGGASSILELPREGVGEADLVAAWREDLAAGLPIEVLNQRRAERSCLKAGGLGRILRQRTGRIQVWLLGDTPPGSEGATVGSGPFWLDGAPGPIPHHVLASNGDLVQGAGHALAHVGFSVYLHPPRMAGPVEAEVDSFLDAVERLPADKDVALVGGGEPVLAHPVDAPPGGRCQHAALVAARRLARDRLPTVFLAAGSDGVDGTTREAGAWADRDTWAPGAEEALNGFDAHAYLEDRGCTVRTGHSTTNVNDLWIALRPALLRGAGAEAQARGPLVVK